MTPQDVKEMWDTSRALIDALGTLLGLPRNTID